MVLFSLKANSAFALVIFNTPIRDLYLAILQVFWVGRQGHSLEHQVDEEVPHLSSLFRRQVSASKNSRYVNILMFFVLIFYHFVQSFLCFHLVKVACAFPPEVSDPSRVQSKADAQYNHSNSYQNQENHQDYLHHSSLVLFVLLLLLPPFSVICSLPWSWALIWLIAIMAFNILIILVAVYKTQ